MNANDLISALPELSLTAMILIMVLIAAFSRPESEGKIAFSFSLLTVLVVAVSLYFATALSHSAGAIAFDFKNLPNLMTPHKFFSGLMVFDRLSVTLKLFTLIAFALSFIYVVPYLKSKKLYDANFFLIALFALLGQFVMISAGSMLTVYLGIELLALSMYTLVALPRDDKLATEAGMKYFVLGALASGFLLYGISLLYGATGTLDLAVMLEKVKDILSMGVHTKKTVLVLGLVFVVAGLAFKLGAVPFHAWVPDVYQGSSTPVTLLLAAAPKFAAFALIIRFLVEGLFGLALDWQRMFVVLAVLSLVIGNVTAIVQTNIKRLLAYSTIAHVGFILLGFVSGVMGGEATGAVNAYTSSLFYVVTYVLTTLGTFGVLLIISAGKSDIQSLDDLKGLSKRSPWIAFVMLVLMFSLAGIPPTIGFYAKFVILKSLADAKMYWLAVIAVSTSLVGAFYYLRVVKFMYFDEAKNHETLSKSSLAYAILSVNGLLILILGILPNGLYQYCLDAIRQLKFVL